MFKSITNIIILFCISILTLFTPSLNDEGVNNYKEQKNKNEITTLKENDNIEKKKLKLNFYPLGNTMEGDSFIIEYGHIQILVDAGSYSSSIETIIDHMKHVEYKDKLWDYVIVTHADTDHIAGFSTEIVENPQLAPTPTTVDSDVFQYIVNNNMKIGTLIDFDFTKDDTVRFTPKVPKQPDPIETKTDLKFTYFTTTNYLRYSTKRDQLVNSGHIVNYFTASQCFMEQRAQNGFIIPEDLVSDAYTKPILNGAKSSFDLDKKNDVTLDLLYNLYYDHRPNPLSVQITSGDRNILSVCFVIRFKEQKFLFTGDMVQYDSQQEYKDIQGETKLIKYNKDLLKNVTFFKAAHHGRKTSNCKDFIDYIKPKNVVIPCIAGTPAHKSKFLDRSPAQDVIDNLTKYTDNIYIPSKAILKTEELFTVEDYYGEIQCIADGKNFKTLTTNEKKEVDTTNKFSTPKNIFETGWFRENRQARLNLFSFNGFINSSVAYFGQSTLIKYGNYDILIDAGMLIANKYHGKAKTNSKFIDYLDNFILDNKIELLIVTTPTYASNSQLIDIVSLFKKKKGILNKYSIDAVIDYGSVNDPSSGSDSSNFHTYNKTINELVKNGTKHYSGPDYVYSEYNMDLNLPHGIRLNILDNPNYGYDENNSLCFTIGINNQNMLFTGRLNSTGEREVAYNNLFSNICFYMVNDFANNSSNSKSFLGKISNSQKPYILVNTVPNETFAQNTVASKDSIDRLLKYSSNTGGLLPKYHTFLTIDYKDGEYIDLTKESTDLLSENFVTREGFHFYIKNKTFDDNEVKFGLGREYKKIKETNWYNNYA